MRLFFNIVRGYEIVLDEDGVDVHDIDAAIAEAALTIQEIQGADPEFASRYCECRILISNNAGDIFATFEFCPDVQCFGLSSLYQQGLPDYVVRALAPGALGLLGV
jgi:hypothetical protein